METLLATHTWPARSSTTAVCELPCDSDGSSSRVVRSPRLLRTVVQDSPRREEGPAAAGDRAGRPSVGTSGEACDDCGRDLLPSTVPAELTGDAACWSASPRLRRAACLFASTLAKVSASMDQRSFGGAGGAENARTRENQAPSWRGGRRSGRVGHYTIIFLPGLCGVLPGLGCSCRPGLLSGGGLPGLRGGRGSLSSHHANRSQDRHARPSTCAGRPPSHQHDAPRAAPVIHVGLRGANAARPFRGAWGGGRAHPALPMAPPHEQRGGGAAAPRLHGGDALRALQQPVRASGGDRRE